MKNAFHRVIVVTDENVSRLYPFYFDELKNNFEFSTFVFPAGEASKSITTAVAVWKYLADNCCDKRTFLLNFGGGMVCDLGGFVASAYKRGIHFANIPTTLLAMIDASIGGKTAIDIDNLKNIVGAFHFPDIVLDPDISLLKTLPYEEFLSGAGELVKYSLIGSKQIFSEISEISDFKAENLKEEWVKFCTDYKLDIVRKDPYDKGIRHVLNFGHTIGHAIEGLSAEEGIPVAHGLAVAQGLFYESYLSYKTAGLSLKSWKNISIFLSKHFKIEPITKENFIKMTRFLLNDKKNEKGFVNFTLLSEIGKPETDCCLSLDEISNLLTNIDCQK